MRPVSEEQPDLGSLTEAHVSCCKPGYELLGLRPAETDKLKVNEREQPQIQSA